MKFYKSKSKQEKLYTEVVKEESIINCKIGVRDKNNKIFNNFLHLGHLLYIKLSLYLVLMIVILLSMAGCVVKEESDVINGKIKEIQDEIDNMNSTCSDKGITINQSNGVIESITIETVMTDGAFDNNKKDNVITGSEVLELLNAKVTELKQCGLNYKIVTDLPKPASEEYKGIICSKKKMNYDAVQDIIDGKDTEDTVGYDTLEYTVKPHETLEKIAFENGVTVEDILKYNEGLDRDNIEGKTINVPAHQIIRNMYDLSKKITSFKERRGELKFSGDEVKVVQDENDNVIDIKARDQRPSERIIEDFMVAANEQICEFLIEYGLATFRVHAKPLEKKMREYLEFLEGLGIHYSGKIDVENISSKDCQMLLEYLKDEKAFILELSYGAVVSLNIPEEHREPVLMIEIPHMLYPFVRQIVANTLTNAGLPALMLNPIDFMAMYNAKKAKEQKTN